MLLLSKMPVRIASTAGFTKNTLSFLIRAIPAAVKTKGNLHWRSA
jgi:hypothetical protein